MELIGDLERMLAQLYPYRVPIAVGLALAVAALAWVGWRRGWQRVPRRHPRAFAIGLVAALAVGGPLAWYLGSPLFIRVELQEDVATASGPVIATGTFSGADEFHFGGGTVSVVEVGPDEYSLRFEDFSVRNGPDLFVYLSPDPDGYVEGSYQVGRLRATDGSFVEELNVGAPGDTARSVVIWCKQFGVLFAVAPLGPPTA